jgi:hypothetical protein
MSKKKAPIWWRAASQIGTTKIKVKIPKSVWRRIMPKSKLRDLF